jgi:leucyl aminopeptidase (aminopeptidase T)
LSLAHQVVNRCLNIAAKDNVTIFLYPHSIPMAEELADECFKKGADVLLNLYTDRYLLSYMKNLSVESLREPSIFCRALTEASSVEIWMGATDDPTVLRKIPAEKSVASSEGEAKAHWPLTKERKVRAIDIGLSLVTKKRAEVYGFDFAKWSQMMNDATNVDYVELRKTGRELRDVLSKAKAIHVTGPGGTDLRFRVDGRPWFLSDGVIDEADLKEGLLDDSIPAGRVYAAPLEDSTEGKVVFNVKTPYAGRTLGRLEWAFKGGKLVGFRGDASIRALKEEYDRSTGDKDRIGYLSVGFNPKARTGFTLNNIAMGSVSVGIGGNEDFGGVNKRGFFFVDTLAGATLEADGKTIVRKGRLA